MGALGLPSDLSGVGPSPHYLARLKEATLCNRLIREAPVQSVILEAEMVAYNEDMDEIDEFANLTHCVENSDKADQYVFCRT